MFVCYVCGKENPSESAKFCNECGPTKKWEASEVDLPSAVEQYTLFYSEIYFEHSADEAEKMSARVREKNRVSAQTHKKIAQALAEQKKSIEHLSQFMLEFDENVVDAYAGGDTYLKFRFTNLSDDEFYKVSIEWDDPETGDDQDLKISSKSFVKPDSGAFLGGSHIFSRIGVKEISDLMITVSDNSQQSAIFRASTFTFKVNNPDQRVTQNFSTTNQISIEGRGVVDNSGNSAEKNLSAAGQSQVPKWVKLHCVYVPSLKPSMLQSSLHVPLKEERDVARVDKADSEPSDFDRNDLQSVISASEAGSIRATHLLGVEYMFGGRVDKNYARALECFMKCAYQDYAPSQGAVGLMYKRGWGVTEDQTTAFEWFTKASKQNLPDAQYYLGECYYKGEGVAQDFALAVEWYRKAAVQGDGGANLMLGFCYRDGEGVERNPVEAKEYFEAASKCGTKAGTYQLAMLYINGQGVVKDERRGAELLLKTAYEGDSDSQYMIANFYYVGDVIPKDFDLAIEFATKAALSGDSDAEELLGDIYSDDSYGGRDISVAIDWYRKAVESGNQESEEKLQQLMQSVKSLNEYQYNSPAMNECLQRVFGFLEIFEGLKEDPCPWRVLNRDQLDPELLGVIASGVQQACGWDPDCFFGLVVQNESASSCDDGEVYDGFEGDATAIYNYGLFQIRCVDGEILPATGDADVDIICFDSIEPESLCFKSWEGETTNGIYLGTTSNEAIRGFLFEYDPSIDLEPQAQTIANANSWVERALEIAKGSVDRDEVLFPVEEGSEGSDEDTIAGEEEDVDFPDDEATVVDYTYVGPSVNGSPHGVGKMIYGNGDVYKGDFVNGMRHGLGEYTFADGTQQTGHFFENEFRKDASIMESMKIGYKIGAL